MWHSPLSDDSKLYIFAINCDAYESHTDDDVSLQMSRLVYNIVCVSANITYLEL